MSSNNVDIKSVVKLMKQHLDSATYSDVVKAAAALPAAQLTAAGSDAKLKSLAYTFHAFLGLARFHLKEYNESEKSYLAASDLQSDQFPAWKGLADLYVARGSAIPKEKLKSVLEKLVPLAPAGIKKIGYTLQLARLQLESSSSSPSTSDLQSTLQSLLADKSLASVPADSKDPAKDAAEIKRLKFEAQFLLVLCAESIEFHEKEKELKVRLDRQLKKYRDERAQADRLKAQQAASKAGQIASAVKAAKGGAAERSQAEEEAEIVRKVTLKLDKDFLEKNAIDQLYESTINALKAEPVDDNRIALEEKVLARTLLRIQVNGGWNTSAESFSQSLDTVTASSEKLFELSPSKPSAYATRLLVGLRWNIGDSSSSAVGSQAFFERAVEILNQTTDNESASFAWVAWQALASSMASTEIATKIPLPPALNELVSALPSPPSVFELSEIIIKNVNEPVPAAATASSASSAVISSTPPTPTAPSTLFQPSPVLPLYLSPVTLSYTLQRQGESKQREATTTVQLGLNALKAYRAAFAFDIEKPTRAGIHLDLTLAAAYANRTLDERMQANAEKIFERVARTLREKRTGATVPAWETAAHRRALQGLTSIALAARPRPRYSAAEQYAQQVEEISPATDSTALSWAAATRGFLKLEEARLLKRANKPHSLWLPLLKDSAVLLEKSSQQSNDASLFLRLGCAYFEQDVPELDQDRRDQNKTLRAFQQAESLTEAALNAATAAPATASSSSSTSATPAPASTATASSNAIASLRAQLAEARALGALWKLRVGGESEESGRKLLAKALQVDPSNETAGDVLCDMLLADTRAKESARFSAVQVLALAAVQANPRSNWAWRRLARTQMAKRAHAAALVSLQNSLRVSGDANDRATRRVWQQLAECYAAEGQLVAANKAMQKCVSLAVAAKADLEASGDASAKEIELERSERVSEYFQLAQSQLRMGNIDETASTLETLLYDSSSSEADSEAVIQSPVYIPALKLLSESLYVQANARIQQGAYEAAFQSLDRALNVARRCVDAIQQYGGVGNRQYASVWKLIGDIYACFNSLPTDTTPPPAQQDPSSQYPLCEARKISYLSLSTRAYAKVMHLDPTVSESWYDCALGELKAALALHAPPPVGANQLAIDEAIPVDPLESVYRSRAYAFLKGALILAPENTCYWHLLSIIDTRPLVRQHAFSKAVTVDPKDSVGWTALGCFYLQRYHSALHSTHPSNSSGTAADERQVYLGLSRHALEIAQTLDPSNPSLWMAQGFFNTSVASLEAYVQAKACFIRSVELFPTQVARFGLAYTAYCTGDISTARFAIRKFVEQYPRHATGWNLAGLIFEHVAVEANREHEGFGVVHAREAVEAFVRAEEFLVEQVSSRTADLIRMVRVNRARALSAAGMHAESITLYQSLIQAAAALAQSGNQASVLASALKLHVDLTAVYMKAGAVVDATNVLQTAIAISAQQVAGTPVGEPQRGELILAYRGLLLQQAQLQSMLQQHDTAKQLLQQSVTEHADAPHPLHYFSVMSALYALSLQQKDLASANYAVSMMAACMNGLLASDQSEEVMSNLQATYYRIQAQLAVLTNDAVKARRSYQKLIHLNPTSMESWNEFYRSLLNYRDQFEEASAACTTILTTSTLPSLDFVHSNRIPEKSFYQRLELLAMAFLQSGRTGYTAGAVVAEDNSVEREEKDLWKEANEAAENDDVEWKDEGADEDVRANQLTLSLPSANSVEDIWPRRANLNSGRISAQLLHMDPTNTSSWGIQAVSVYAQAVQTSDSDSKSASPLFTKAIKLLQMYTSLLTAELNSPNARNPSVAACSSRAAMLDLCNCQILLIDSLLRRKEGEDVQQASLLLNSIVEQQKAQGAAFPLDNALIWLMFARLSVASGDMATALKYYRSAIECKPMAVPIWEELSATYMQQQSTAAAEATLTAAVTVVKSQPATGSTPALLHRLYLRLAFHHWQLKHSDKAVEFVQLARSSIADGDSSATAYFLLGMFQLALNHPDQAMRAFQSALNLHEAARDYHYVSPLAAAHMCFPLASLNFNLGLLFMRSSGTSNANANALHDAREFFNLELQSGVQAAPIYYQLALVSQKLNDPVAAKTYIMSALQLKPQYQPYVALMQQLPTVASPPNSSVSSASEMKNWDE